MKKNSNSQTTSGQKTKPAKARGHRDGKSLDAGTGDLAGAATMAFQPIAPSVAEPNAG